MALRSHENKVTERQLWSLFRAARFGWLKTTRVSARAAPEAASPQSVGQQGRVPSEGSREGLSSPIPAPEGGWQPQAGRLWLLAAPLESLPPLPHGLLSFVCL